MELKPLQFIDILKIKKDLVEGRGHYITEQIAKSLEKTLAFTCFKDGKVVACAGVGNLEEGIVDGWAIYSKKFLPITRARAAKLFMQKLNELIHQKVRILIPDDLQRGKRYAKHLGFSFMGKESSKLFDISNDIFIRSA